MGVDLRLVAFGVAVVGTIGVNIGHFVTQRVHRRRDYCQLPLAALNGNAKAIQLLGGKPIKITSIDLSKAQFNPREAKLTVPVRGNTRRGWIYTLSTRPDKDSEWNMQYAIMKIRHGEYKWNVWLHPEDGGVDSNTDLLPDDVQESLN